MVVQNSGHHGIVGLGFFLVYGAVDIIVFIVFAECGVYNALANVDGSVVGSIDSYGTSAVEVAKRTKIIIITLLLRSDRVEGIKHASSFEIELM